MPSDNLTAGKPSGQMGRYEWWHVFLAFLHSASAIVIAGIVMLCSDQGFQQLRTAQTIGGIVGIVVVMMVRAWNQWRTDNAGKKI
jgi:ABC-type transport system involved in cytochrome bd biosynthesis fused ATPase/permease subunit